MVSTYRLDETLYGLMPNKNLLYERLLKEAVHELRHTFGLIHFKKYECVMHSSTTGEEVDVKKVEMCAACRLVVERNI